MHTTLYYLIVVVVFVIAFAVVYMSRRKADGEQLDAQLQENFRGGRGGGRHGHHGGRWGGRPSPPTYGLGSGGRWGYGVFGYPYGYGPYGTYSGSYNYFDDIYDEERCKNQCDAKFVGDAAGLSKCKDVCNSANRTLSYPSVYSYYL